MDITKDLPPMTIGSYLMDVVMGVFLWIPFAIMAIVTPVVGWVMIPMIPIFPFVYPFIKRNKDKNKLFKLRKKAVQEAQYKATL